MFSPVQQRHPHRLSPISTATKAEKLGVTPDKVFEALQVYLGSAYINDFNYLGRTYEVMAQADGQYRHLHRGHRPA